MTTIRSRLAILNHAAAIGLFVAGSVIAAPATKPAAPRSDESEAVKALLRKAVVEASEPDGLPKAAADFEQALMATHRQSEAALLGLANLREKQNSLDAAVMLDREAVALSPDRAEPVRQLVQHLLVQGKTGEVVAVGFKAIERFPDDAALLRSFGKACLKEKDSAEALDAFKRVAELEPRDIEAHVQLAQIYFSQKKLKQTADEIDTAFKLDPRNFELNMAWGEICTLTNDLDSAYKAYQTAGRLKPTSPEPENNMGFVLVRRSVDEQKSRQFDAAQINIDAARTHFKNALALKPDFASAGANLKVADKVAEVIQKSAATQPATR